MMKGRENERNETNPKKHKQATAPFVISNPCNPFPNKMLYPPFDTECHGNVKSTSSNTRMEKNIMHKKQTRTKKIRNKKRRRED